MKLRSHQRGLSRAVLTVLVGLLVLTSAEAQQTFEGFVTVGQFGRFPTGLYGATNLVPPNSLVLVQNLETGQTERVIITEGVDQPGVFLVLAPAAAELLGVSASGTVRARVSEIATSDIRRSDDRIERSLSQDPDINPAAGGTSLLDTLPSPVGVDEPAEEPAEVAEREPDPEPEPEATPVVEAEPQPELETEPTEEPAVAETTPELPLPAKDRVPRSSAAGDDPSIARVDTPEDTLVPALPEVSPPPQRVAAAEEPSLAGLGPLAPAATPFDPLLVEAQPVDEERPDATLAGPTPEVVDPEVSLAEAEPVGDERPEVAISGPQPGKAETYSELAEAQPVDEERPEEPFAASDPEGAVEPPPEDAVLALEPADFRSPESEPEPTVPEPESEPEPVVAEREPAPLPERPALPIVEELEDEQFYLQIGAYGDPATAEVTVNALAATYPMSVIPIDRGAQTIYRVLVGPVNRDETGTLLLFLRARGYADAFLRSGNEL